MDENVAIEDMPLKEIVRMAREFDFDFAYEIGRRYEHGIGLRRNLLRAALWYRKADRLGHSTASNDVARLSCCGELDMSPRNVHVLMDLKNTDAAHLWGEMHNSNSDFDWYELRAGYYRAAQCGDIDAAVEMAFSFDEEFARKHGFRGFDIEEATYWYRMAAEKGHHYAQYRLGVLIAYHKYVPQNYNEALIFLKKAANAGMLEATSEYDRLHEFKTMERLSVGSSKWIDDGCMMGWQQVRGIDVNEGVEEIGDRAFYNCRSLNEIMLPASLKKIGRNVFGCNDPNLNSGLISFRIPPNLEFLDPMAFGPNSMRFEKFECDPENKGYKEIDGLLYSADGEVLIRCPQGRKGIVVVPKGVMDVAEGAFAYCKHLTKITFLDDGTDPGPESAYVGCSENLEKDW